MQVVPISAQDLVPHFLTDVDVVQAVVEQVLLDVIDPQVLVATQACESTVLPLHTDPQAET